MQGILNDSEYEGIIPRSINLLFDSILNANEDLEFTVKVSMLEIYMEKIRDLLDINRINLNIREDKVKGIYIEDISEYYVSSKEEIIELMSIGSDNRAIASTNMNETSSRSHSIVIISLHQKNNRDKSAKSSKLVLVDLAGSEKISKTGASGLTLEEAKTINKSLTSLGMVINSLTDGKSNHIPYRESKLTRVLQESLGGNSKTCLIMACSPSVYNEAETLSTLRFGNRAKNIKNKPKINKEVTVSELQLVIENLENSLKAALNRIDVLEKFIIDNNLDLPTRNSININTIRKEIADRDYTINKNIDNNYTEGNNKSNTEDIASSDYTTVYDTRIIKVKDRDDYYKNDYLDNEENEAINSKQFRLLTNQLKEERNLVINQSNKIDELNNIINANDKLIIKLKLSETELNNKIKEINDLINTENNSNNDICKKCANKINKKLTINTSDNDINYIPVDNSKFDLYNYDNNQAILSTNNDLNSCLKYNRESINKDNTIINSEIKKEIDSIESNVNNINNNKELIEDFQHELKLLENEKLFIIKVLEEKSNKLAQCEIEIKQLNETIKTLENKILPEERHIAKKVLILEKNIQELNNMYQQSITNKSVISTENQILNKKLKKNNDRILILEKEIYELKDLVSIYILNSLLNVYNFN